MEMPSSERIALTFRAPTELYRKPASELLRDFPRNEPK